MKEDMKILVPVDGSETAERASAFAGDFAAALGASIDLLFVAAFDKDTPKDKERYIPVDLLVASMQRPEDVFAKAKQAIPEGVAVACHAEKGMPAEKILAFSRAHGHELIIIGNKGTTAVESFLLGSVGQKVMEEAESSVIVVK